jgi:hypothetical protein
VLLIHQALGRGVLEHIKPHQAAAKTSLVNSIERTIKPLLPKPHNIQPKLKKIIDRAVELANEMTIEQALFRCYIIVASAAFNLESMELSDDAQSGRVLFCTFPAFAKRLVEDDQDIRSYILKANVELESIMEGVSRDAAATGECIV